ncbi:MAG: ABC transporter permease [Planctomycetota bacterium]|nr:ABC transporter permease [Planctomycetota bacterium]
MSRTWEILKREYIENVRTKAFLIGLVLTPVWMGLIFVIPLLISAPESIQVTILDQTGELAGPLTRALDDGAAEDAKADLPKGKAIPKGRTSFEVTTEPAEGAWDAGPDGTSRFDRLKLAAGSEGHYVVVITAAVLEKRERAEGEPEHGIYGPAIRGMGSPGRLIESVVTDLVTKRLLSDRELPADLAELIQQPATKFHSIDRTGGKASQFRALMPILVVMLLYMGIVGISQMLISNTIEEKANRVYEVLLSSVSPFQLMSGKILGICGVGLTLLTFWTGGGLAAAAMQGSSDVVSAGEIVWFAVYYLLGFLMIASLFVAVGSACNTIKEAQNLMAPLSMLLALPMIISLLTMSNPNGTVATVASFIPPFTPFVMMTRMASVPAPPVWQTWATLGILLISTYLAIRFAARVFRVGILLYGQPPSLGEIWRWMWQSE